MKLWPIMGVLGARQSGKTTLLRDIISNGLKSRYVSLDSKSLRDQAQRAPELFLSAEAEEFETLIIDEVQKAPDLFDALKAKVDLRRRPGQFILSGSPNFHKK
jgi:uncharacterized protein